MREGFPGVQGWVVLLSRCHLVRKQQALRCGGWSRGLKVNESRTHQSFQEDHVGGGEKVRKIGGGAKSGLTKGMLAQE